MPKTKTHKKKLKWSKPFVVDFHSGKYEEVCNKHFSIDKRLFGKQLKRPFFLTHYGAGNAGYVGRFKTMSTAKQVAQLIYNG